jgi:hypothetical protein
MQRITRSRVGFFGYVVSLGIKTSALIMSMYHIYSNQQRIKQNQQYKHNDDSQYVFVGCTQLTWLKVYNALPDFITFFMNMLTFLFWSVKRFINMLCFKSNHTLKLMKINCTNIFNYLMQFLIFQKPCHFHNFSNQHN